MESKRCEIVVDDERQIDYDIVALTTCEVTFKSEDDLNKCIEAIKISTSRLNNRPLNEVKYDWQNPVYTRGLSLHFGVRWFDRAFYSEKRNVYKDTMHESLFAKFGVTPDTFTVSHFVAA